MGHIVPHLAALCYLLPIREGHFLMNTLHHANLSGWDFLRLAEQASGQPAKKKQGGKYQLPCPLRDHAKPWRTGPISRSHCSSRTRVICKTRARGRRGRRHSS